MGEDCCGGSAAAPDVQLPNGAEAKANGVHKPQLSHKEAAEQLQGFIAKRIQLFDGYHERELQQASHAPVLRSLKQPALIGTPCCALQPAPAGCATAAREPLQEAQLDCSWHAHRCRLHPALQQSRAQVAAARERNEQLTITLPDGGTKAAVKGVTTPLDIAGQLSKSLAKQVVVADVDGGKWDLFRPLEHDCRLELHTFENAKGKDVRCPLCTELCCPASHSAL